MVVMIPGHIWSTYGYRQGPSCSLFLLMGASEAPPAVPPAPRPWPRSHPSTKIEGTTGPLYIHISTINGRNHYSHRCLDASTILAWNHYSQRCLHDIYYKWPWNHYSQRCLHDLLPPQRLTPKRGITTAIDVCTTYYHLNDLDRAIVRPEHAYRCRPPRKSILGKTRVLYCLGNFWTF